MVSFVINREMTITHAEFFRLLPKALVKRHYEVNGSEIKVMFNQGWLEISLNPETIRSIGALKLPITKVNYEFFECRDFDIEQFMTGFDLVYQKGGG